MQTAAIIPARGGSKAIPRKNLAPLGGLPLIAWRIRSAIACRSIDRVIVSTDDEEIADVSRSHGAEVPFLRPPELAQDDTPGIAPCLHAARWLDENQGYRPDYLIYLQPTSPLCPTHHLDAVVAMAESKRAESIVSVSAVSKHPNWMKTIDEQGRLQDFLPRSVTIPRRQDLPPVYVLNGAIYCIQRDTLMATEKFVGPETLAYVMPPEDSLDIDSLWDLTIANLIVQSRNGTRQE